MPPIPAWHRTRFYSWSIVNPQCNQGMKERYERLASRYSNTFSRVIFLSSQRKWRQRRGCRHAPSCCTSRQAAYHDTSSPRRPPNILRTLRHALLGKNRSGSLCWRCCVVRSPSNVCGCVPMHVTADRVQSRLCPGVSGRRWGRGGDDQDSAAKEVVHIYAWKPAFHCSMMAPCRGRNIIPERTAQGSL